MCQILGHLKLVNFHLEQMENLLFLGVPILMHIMVYHTENSMIRGQTV